MKQHGIGKNPVKAFTGQIQLQKVLLPDLTATVCTGHLRELLRAVQAHSRVAHAGKRLQIAPRATAEIENVERRATLDMPQQSVDILADIMIASTFAKPLGHRVVMAQGGGGDFFQVVGGLLHGGLRGNGDAPNIRHQAGGCRAAIREQAAFPVGASVLAKNSRTTRAFCKPA